MDMFIKKCGERNMKIIYRFLWDVGRKNVASNMKLNRINKLSVAASVVPWMIIGVSFILIIYYIENEWRIIRQKLNNINTCFMSPLDLNATIFASLSLKQKQHFVNIPLVSEQHLPTSLKEKNKSGDFYYYLWLGSSDYRRITRW